MCVARVDKLKVIMDWAESNRKKLGITSTPGIKWELSCEMFGEFNNLISQLLRTDTGTGVWKELDDENVLNLVYDGIKDER